MPFSKPLPRWDKIGTEPPESLKVNGWQVQQKPPADYFNHLQYTTYQALKELQEKAQHKDDPITITDASLTQKGITQLSIAINSTSETTAATPKAVKTVNDDLVTHKVDYLSHTGYANVTGSANAYIATLSPALSAYAEGVSLRVKINVDNTGAATLNVNGLGVKAIKKANGSDVNAGQLKANGVYTLSYNGTAFILQGEGSELSDAEMTNIINAVNGILGA